MLRTFGAVATLTEERKNTTRTGDWLSHLFAYAFAVNFLFGSVSVLNTLELSFFFNYPRTINISLIDPRFDLLIWVVSAASLSALMIWVSHGRAKRALQIGIALFAVVLSPTLLVISRPTFLHTSILYVLFVLTAVEFALLAFKKISPNAKYHPARPSLVLIYLLASLMVMETSSALYFVIRSFGGTTQIGLIDAGIELQLSYAAYGLIPWLYVAFLFSWLWVPLVQKLIFSRNRLFQTASNTDLGHDSLVESSSGSRLSKLLDPRLFLVLAVAVFIGYYPYFQSPPWLVGTDAYWRYFDPLMRMNSKGGFGGILQALDERHPVPLIVLYAAQLIFQTSAYEVVKYAPMFLVVGLAFAVWWFVGVKARFEFGLVAFLISTLSVTTTVGYYSSILANWIALVCWVVFFAYVSFRGPEHLKAFDFLVLFGLSTLILLIHPWTWGVFAASVVLAAIFALLQQRRKVVLPAALMLLVVLIDGIFAFLSITLLAQTQGWRVVDALDLYVVVFNDPSKLLWFWDAVRRLTEIWSPFFSPLYLTLSILGVFCLGASNLSPWRRSLIMGWLCVSALGSILVAPIGFDPTRPTETESQLWRMLFLTPFQLAAPFGIAWLLRLPNLLRSSQNVGESQVRTVLMSRSVWLGALVAIGIGLALAPVWGRLLLLTALLPLATAFFLSRSNICEKEFLIGALLLTILLVFANSTMRSLSLLLIDPHNYRP